MNGNACSRLIACIALSSISACSSMTTPIDAPGTVADMWSSRLRQYSINPVFPPRADIQVGDIYMVCVDTTGSPKPLSQDLVSRTANDAGSDAPEMQPLWLASIGKMIDDSHGAGLLTKEYAGRVQMPVIALPNSNPAGGEVAGANANAAAPVPASGVGEAGLKKKVKLAKPGAVPGAAAPSEPGATPVFAAAPLTSLRPVSFPEFFSVSATTTQASAIVPLHAILAGIGVSAQDVKSVEISIPQAESYGLPVSSVLEALLSTPQAQRAGIKSVFKALQNQHCKSGSVGLELVTEIYASRAIDVSISFTKEAGAEAQVGISIADDAQKTAIWKALGQYFSTGTQPAPGKEGEAAAAKPADATKPADVAHAAPTPSPTPDQATAFVAQLNKLASQLGGTKPLQYPGVEVSVVHGSNSGVTLNRQFASPVVIGYRGVVLKPDALDQ